MAATVQSNRPRGLPRVVARAYRRTAWLPRTVGSAALTTFLVLVTAFTLIRLAPGSPESIFIGLDASPEQIARFRAENGLDRPFLWQFLSLVGNMVRGDFGDSLLYGTEVFPLVMSRLWATVLLVAAGFVTSIVLGVAMGTIAGWRPRSWFARLAAGYTWFFYSQPEFLTGALVVVLASAWLPWLPTSGMSQPGLTGADRIADMGMHLIAPTVVLAASRAAVYVQIASVAVQQVRRQDFIRTHRAYGFSESFILWRYALRNALLPVISTIGIEFRHLLAGAVVVEVIFSWPGFGRLLYDAIVGRDYALILGGFVIVSVLTIVINLLTDLSYRFADPRVRRSQVSDRG